jgi:Flp pilus assembly protein TadG
MRADPTGKLGGTKGRSHGAAAVEFAVCLPLICLILSGLWEVGRSTEVSEVMWNSAREAARDASLGEDKLATVAANLLIYLQGAEPTAFGLGHATSMIAPVISLPPNTTGYTCWDTTTNRELFTMTYSDLTTPTNTDPTTAKQLDVYLIGVQVPYRSITISPLSQVTGLTRLSVSVDWASLVDTPFKITPYIPAE